MCAGIRYPYLGCYRAFLNTSVEFRSSPNVLGRRHQDGPFQGDLHRYRRRCFCALPLGVCPLRSPSPQASDASHPSILHQPPFSAFGRTLTISVPAIPQVIAKPDASLGVFFVSIIVLAFAAGFIKPSLGPLLCDQSPVKKPTLKVLKPKKEGEVGETVIVDPGVTVSRWLLIFYWCINVGAFFASMCTL